uniref:Uncharacterized protein n=1 Tax=Oryza sativa subsp. japonica TaxID=39947 RepID=Q338B3_ORYSJ|nr:hypothetical protein LOC_Os10g28280 [Oryza sativa Japonica Group]
MAKRQAAVLAVVASAAAAWRGSCGPHGQPCRAPPPSHLPPAQALLSGDIVASPLLSPPLWHDRRGSGVDQHGWWKGLTQRWRINAEMADRHGGGGEGRCSGGGLSQPFSPVHPFSIFSRARMTTPQGDDLG